jgi:hypothetical protein
MEHGSQAARLAALSNALADDSFDARTVILVEGESDALAVEAFARRTHRDLAAEDVGLLPLGGGGGLGSHLDVLRTAPSSPRLLGLCDADHERRWARQLEASGFAAAADRNALERLGFFVCDPDLETELLRALGTERTLALIARQGEAASFRTLSKQPAQQGWSDEALLRRFFGSKSGRKALYAPLLVAAIPGGAEPRPLVELLARV